MRFAAGPRMHICQVITPSKIAGAERSTTSLCEHLQAAGHRVVVGCKSGSPLIPVMRQVGLDCRPLAISGKANLAAPFRIAELARETGAQVLHSHLSTAAFHTALAGRLTGLPAVAHVRALNTAHWYRMATRVIAVSHAVKAHLVGQGMDGSRIDVVYNGIDPARYYLPMSREDARSKLGLPAEATLVGVVAHLTAKKGHAVFLDAFAAAAAKHSAAQALFLGDGDERESLAAHAERLGVKDRVLFAGFQQDVLPYYAALDVVVLPSIDGEGLPRALLEGGMLRRATIGTRLSGVPEIIRDGETGFVVPIGDAGAMAERLDQLLGDAPLRERMGAAGHDYVAATFTIEAMVNGVVESYRKAGAHR
jgi:glycosyltransferase involved in cell wall biosynthesis